MTALIEVAAVVIPAILICSLGIYFDYRDWNGGVSPNSGRPWKPFDTDSQGGRGYTDDAGNYIWLSWIKPRT